ncbi:[acyl-carrier-protein] S-malonyltransferase [Streptomyces sp. Ru62]|uniref:ACP S-malonyltransferase n=1 Tax=Streptomyces sp. Ru62 TaxID=2080745 RepID=UPI000CDD1DF0|nr:ACP S-malonyltransferase [Streptomyces sp. Ru62]POX57467.1 [acyl-carrier-protein] S-malonyltransferase [Streptomyces sp. Ru62]
MASTAFVFPGQGSQRVGMGADFVQRRPDLVDTYYRAADDLLGFPLSRLCHEGPAEALRDTAITQPAVFLTEIVVLDVLRAHDVVPDVVAGHSLGEYAAAVCADALSWQDALRLVRLRGRLMAEVNERVPGAMAAVVGLDLPTVRALCARAAADTGQVLEVANDNEPAQTVVSGQTKAVRALVDAAKEAGARRVVPLGVGAPFHCSLMRDIEEEFAEALAAVDFRSPSVPMVSSVTGAPVTSVEEIVSALRRQLSAPVLWTGTVRTLAGLGVRRYVEVGPGRVLSGLCRRTEPTARAFSTGTVGELAATVEALASDRAEDGVEAASV